MRQSKRAASLVLLTAALAGCREGVDPTSGPILPISTIGADGCNGPDQAFAGALPIAPVAVWSSPAVAPTSRMTAAQGMEELYLTGADGVVLKLDFSAGDPPVETEVLPAGFITSNVLALAGITDDAVISGIALTNADFLVVMEHTGNVVVSARRNPPTLATAYGTPNADGGFVNGQLFSALFRFDEPADLCSTGDGRIFIPDSGNNVIREIEATSEGIFVSTVAGTGEADSVDGDPTETAFDTPAGLKLDCADQLIITERGNFGGGNRIRAVLFEDTSFSFFPFSSSTLAGDGEAQTEEGVDEDSSVAWPSGAVTTSKGDVYWVDRLTGVLRRYDFSTGLADCPLDVDCTAAVGSTVLTPGGDFSLTISDAGDLYVLDTTAQTLYRIP
ncbi:MAG: hypothetical protein AAF682_18135 [Planctomycetota bacterium]